MWLLVNLQMLNLGSFSYDIYGGVNTIDEEKIGTIQNLVQGGVYRVVLEPNENEANNYVSLYCS